MSAPRVGGVRVLLPALAGLAACLSSPGLLELPDTPALSISPSAKTVPPRGAIAVGAAGGSGGHRFSLALDGSGGSVDEVTGAYVAGERGNTSDVVQVEDSAGHVAKATFTVGPPISVTPLWLGVAPGVGPVEYVASGGSGAGHRWELATNGSGGHVSASTSSDGVGLYTAGTVQPAEDQLQVTDSLGNVGTAWAEVGYVIIHPAPPPPWTPPWPVEVAAGGPRNFFAAVTGMPERNVSWEILEGPSGGTITATTLFTGTAAPTCAYVAPADPGTYHLRATSVADPERFDTAEILVVPAP